MREQYRIVEAKLLALGTSYHLRPGGKHARYEIDIPGHRIIVPIATSPRDRHYAGLNTARQIERALAALTGTTEASGA